MRSIHIARTTAAIFLGILLNAEVSAASSSVDAETDPDVPRDCQPTGKVRQKNKGAFQDADKHKLTFVCIVSRDLRGQFTDPGKSRLTLLLRIAWLDNADVRKRPVLLRVVQTVANHPLVTDGKSQVVDIDVDFGLVLFV